VGFFTTEPQPKTAAQHIKTAVVLKKSILTPDL
jgi:hypothetical protein